MSEPTRIVRLADDVTERADALLTREWLVTNGIGGYASTTLASVPTRRYHGILVAALPNPLGRTVMLTELAERVRLADGNVAALGGDERATAGLTLPAAEHVRDFRLEALLPVWTFTVGDALLEKRVWMPFGQNTVHVHYRYLEGSAALRLHLRPALNFRAVEEPVSTPLRAPYGIAARDDRFEIEVDPSFPPLRVRMIGRRTAFTIEPQRMTERLYRVESRRGYEDTGDMWSPGYFRADLDPGEAATFVASTEPWSTLLALSADAAHDAERERRRRLLCRVPDALRTGTAAELVLAADAFVVTPAYRAEEVAQKKAIGDELRSVIAGYHWFTDWGRDTMIALEGLTLCTGRYREAGEILRTFAQYTRDGLIPNMFPNGSSEGRYNTADASLWFFHALDRYFATTRDASTLQQILPTLRSIADCHLHGTHFGIRIDDDGLMTQGAESLQLTWMDAKVDGWVVTPRRGKAVELNALWYNALCLLAGWLQRFESAADAETYGQHASRCYESFNRRFWNEAAGCLYDVVDGEHGDDDAVRPNQLFALSLRHPVLAQERWEAVVRVARERLLTPVGMRSLAPGHPAYRSHYRGDLRARDAAYHQGTVWPWLIGPFIDAWLRVHPADAASAHRFLTGLIEHMDEFGVGSIAEVFDAEEPYDAGGCIAQAWSVAEVLRCWLRTNGIM
jgi:predicted glycogen debranching enzyme